jgi:hypothetical protein
MKIATIALAAAFATSSTFALAQMGGGNGEGATLPERSGNMVNGQGGTVRDGSMEHRTTGMSREYHPRDSGNPNGGPGGPTTLSGTGSSRYGGVSSPGIGGDQ